MAVSPYINRAELWLANSSFRTAFVFPDYFHPSIFVKWYPGHMSKGERLEALALQTVTPGRVFVCACTVIEMEARNAVLGFIMASFFVGLRVMQTLLQKCDCVLEVHDARISFMSVWEHAIFSLGVSENLLYLIASILQIPEMLHAGMWPHWLIIVLLLFNFVKLLHKFI